MGVINGGVIGWGGNWMGVINGGVIGWGVRRWGVIWWEHEDRVAIRRGGN